MQQRDKDVQRNAAATIDANLPKKEDLARQLKGINGLLANTDDEDFAAVLRAKAAAIKAN